MVRRLFDIQPSYIFAILANISSVDAVLWWLIYFVSEHYVIDISSVKFIIDIIYHDRIKRTALHYEIIIDVAFNNITSVQYAVNLETSRAIIGVIISFLLLFYR